MLFSLCVVLIGCTADPISDRSSEAMIAHCKDLGMRAYVFNGIVSYAKCIPLQEK